MRREFIAILITLSAVPARAQQRPEDELAAVIKSYYGMGLPAPWDGIETLTGFRWAAAATELTNCLPNGDCFARQGTAQIAGRRYAAVASGARTMVANIMLRNMGTPYGDSAILGALGRAGFSAALARCPVRPGAAGTSWYRLSGAGLADGVISIQPAGPGRPNEGYVLSRGPDLPQLQPAQLALYTEQCAPGSERKAVSNVKPHELLAETVVALLANATLYDWQTLGTRYAALTWSGAGPTRMDLTTRGDANPVARLGSLTLAGRQFSVLASGTPTQVRTIYLEESGRHPRGEHMLGVVYEKGITVRLLKCGPVYSQSTNNWYSVQSSGTVPANIRQSITYDGNMVAESYEIRLDGSLPKADPRDRNPGVNGCQ